MAGWIVRVAVTAPDGTTQNYREQRFANPTGMSKDIADFVARITRKVDHEIEIRITPDNG